MQPQDGALLFQVSADQSQIQKDVEAIKKQFEQMTNKAVEEGKKQPPISHYKGRNHSLVKW